MWPSGGFNWAAYDVIGVLEAMNDIHAMRTEPTVRV